MGCGVCGFVGLSDPNLLRSMCKVMTHRGPDDTGYFTDTGIGLGSDRLSIIDLSTGDQPIHNEDQSVWIVFNGEVYNYLELRALLESRGHRFYTHSDTESVVHAYEEWGDGCVSYLRGMFAFAIWDSRRRRLYLARDRFGKKPLYYAVLGDSLLFGSELKAILQYDGIKREIDYHALDLYFTYMYIPSPLTIFKGVCKLPPGNYATYAKGKLALTQYWDISLNPDPTLDEDTVIERLYDAISDAVRVRLRSDVSLGAFLSGGIDSSTVVAFMSRLSEKPVKTVSIGFDEGFSEVKYSRQVADYLGTDHREYIVTPDAYKILPKLVWHFDEPFADHSMIPTYYVSQVTRREVKVALSGDGGDEMFMGYSFLNEPSIFPVYSKIPSQLRRFALRTILSLPAKGQFTRMAYQAYEKNYGDQPPLERYVMRTSVYDGAGLGKLYSKGFLSRHDASGTYSYMFEIMNKTKNPDLLNSIDYATIKSYLEEDILVKVDRMSMAVSLEVRSPFLDQDLVSLVERVPSQLKMNRGTTKYILKRMAVKKNLLPREIVLRKKRGFGAPLESWLKKDWKEATTQLLDPIVGHNYTGLFDRGYVQRLLEEPYLNSNRLFGLAVFVLWYRMYIDDRLATAPPEGASLSV